MTREVEKLITAHRQREGGGFVVRRPFPTAGLERSIRSCSSTRWARWTTRPGEAVGAPDHPHRGFETVTYMLEGELEHEDSAGHRGALARRRRAVDDGRARHRPLRDAVAGDPRDRAGASTASRSG